MLGGAERTGVAPVSSGVLVEQAPIVIKKIITAARINSPAEPLDFEVRCTETLNAMYSTRTQTTPAAKPWFCVIRVICVHFFTIHDLGFTIPK